VRQKFSTNGSTKPAMTSIPDAIASILSAFKMSLSIIELLKLFYFA
jgi:hypothetical protein